MIGDLHTHTTFSDAACDIETLPWLAGRAGLTHLAVSDHDTLLAVDYALAHPVEQGVTLIPATEITCFDKVHGHRAHILCYCPRRTQALVDFCALMAKRRNEANEISLQKLQKLYPQFDAARARQYAQRSGVLYKPNLMRVLMDFGYTADMYGDLYHELFGAKDGKVVQSIQYEPIDDVLHMIAQAGGVAVQAHPSVYHSMELAQALAQAGKIDGVEINHPRNTPQDKEALCKLAKEYNLIVTGGTDFHGMYSARPLPLGTKEYTTNETNIQRILALAKARKE